MRDGQSLFGSCPGPRLFYRNSFRLVLNEKCVVPPAKW